MVPTEKKQGPSEKEIKDMAELLIKGARMLPYHCDDCMSPLFEQGGKVLCPIHGEFRKEAKAGAKEKSRISEPTKEILKKKRDELLKRLEKEEKAEEISAILDALAKIDNMLG